MTWLKLILATVNLLQKFVVFLGNKQLIEAGAAQALAAQLEASQDAANKALAAKTAALSQFDADDDGVLEDDTHLRD